MKRQEFYKNCFSAKLLCFAGIIAMPALVFNPDTELRVLQFLFFWFLVIMSGKKSNPVIVVLTFFCIVAFNLLIPYGRILFSAGYFKITSGALTAGLHRAATFQGLIMLSKFSIREDLILPGSFGKLLGESLRIFTAMMNRKKRITGKNFISDIDNMMVELSEQEVPAIDEKKSNTTFAGFVVLAAVILFSWLPWVKIYLY